MPQSESINSVLSDVIYKNPSGIGAAIENMTHTMIVSLIPFGVPMEGDGNVLDVTAIQETNCTTTENVTLYVYSSGTLLIVYGLAVASALATSVARFIALRHNGMASNRSVSTFIRTTRNRTIDDYIVGADCLGGDVLSSELGKVQLQFGALKAKGTAPFALGVKGESVRLSVIRYLAWVKRNGIVDIFALEAFRFHVSYRRLFPMFLENCGLDAFLCLRNFLVTYRRLFPLSLGYLC